MCSARCSLLCVLLSLSLSLFSLSLFSLSLSLSFSRFFSREKKKIDTIRKHLHSTLYLYLLTLVYLYGACSLYSTVLQDQTNNKFVQESVHSSLFFLLAICVSTDSPCCLAPCWRVFYWARVKCWDGSKGYIVICIE